MLPAIDRDDVLRIVRQRGPIIPNEIRRTLQVGDTLLLGAILSELASRGLIKVSHTKLGGSPFYYDPKQPEKLERIAEHLNEKDQRTYHLLKEKRVLRDDAQEALVRVSLRNIKDFARMLTVNANGELTYWKYYLATDEEAEQLIKQELGIKPDVERVEQPEPTKPSSTNGAATPTPQAEAPKEAARAPEKSVESPARSGQTRLNKDVETLDDPLYARIRAFFDKNDIRILEQKSVRKGGELDFVITLPTPVGDVEYFCKAKQKKRNSDGDLASAKLQGNARSLPVVYLTTGEITKKARQMLQKEFKGMVCKQV